MPVDLVELLGAEMMTPTAKEQVIDAIRRLPLDPSDKQYVYGRWTRMVGLKAEGRDFQRVAAPAAAGTS